MFRNFLPANKNTDSKSQRNNTINPTKKHDNYRPVEEFQLPFILNRSEPRHGQHVAEHGEASEDASAALYLAAIHSAVGGRDPRSLFD